MQLDDAVDMIEYVINAPYRLNVNEISIDPMQTEWPNV
jgi:NADP-dependent 3-hydroxy acid dehydrogenase YdfG